MATAVIETTLGTIEFELLDDEAPKTAANFVTLASKGFYDGVIFHRVVPGFVIQGGDPTGTGTGGPGYTFADEKVTMGYARGTVAMANAGPNTNGSQFFICLADLPQLQELVDRFVQANRLLPRTADELHDLVPSGFVAIAEGHVVGFAALEIYSPKLAEIRSLAVDPGYHGRGIGRGLVSRCVQLAVSRNVLEVMAITSSDGFFKACGFDFTLPGEKKALFIQTRDEY